MPKEMDFLSNFVITKVSKLFMNSFAVYLISSFCLPLTACDQDTGLRILQVQIFVDLFLITMALFFL